MDKSLIDYLKQIPDHRDPHGLRHPLWLVLLIIIMAGLFHSRLKR